MFRRSSARALAKSAWAGLLRGCGVLWLAKKWARREGIVVLTLHRVLTDKEIVATASLPGMIVRRDTFEAFIAYAEKNLDIVNLGSDISWQPNSRPRVALTFDDGWYDNAVEAFPVAQKYGAPMTIFVVPERAGSAMPFWPEQAASVLGTSLADADAREPYIEEVIERLKLLPEEQRKLEIDRIKAGETAHNAAATVDRTMTWHDIERLRSGGVVFGSHTCTHEILTRIPPERAEAEITHSRELIEKRLGAECRLFAYPNGNSSRHVRGLVQRAGYKLAFVNDWPELWTRHHDPYQVPRVNVCEYHLTGRDGKFSPLIFEYAVVWNAVKSRWITIAGDKLRRIAAKLRLVAQESNSKLEPQQNR